MDNFWGAINSLSGICMKAYHAISREIFPLKGIDINHKSFSDGSLSIWVVNNSQDNINIRFLGIRGNNILTGNQYTLGFNDNDDRNCWRQLHLVPAHTASKEIIYSTEELDTIIMNGYLKNLQKDCANNKPPYYKRIRQAHVQEINWHSYFIDVAFQDANNRLIKKDNIPVTKPDSIY